MVADVLFMGDRVFDAAAAESSKIAARVVAAGRRKRDAPGPETGRVSRCGPSPFPPSGARGRGRRAGGMAPMLVPGSPLPASPEPTARKTASARALSAVGRSPAAGRLPTVTSSRDVLEAAAERSRVTFRDRVDRLRRLAPTLLLGAIAAGVSWLIAKQLFGT